jgi:hypothetical protein
MGGSQLHRWPLLVARSLSGTADVLDRLIPAVKKHLGAEEDRVVPLMRQHITVAEWHAPMGSELAADPAQFPLTIGLLMYEGDPESIDQFIAAMPADASPSGSTAPPPQRAAPTSNQEST